MKDCLFTLVPALVAAIMASVAPSAVSPAAEKNALPETYGSAMVSQVLRIAQDGTIYCNIDAFPPVLGRDIPVILEGIEHTTAGTVDKDVIAFLTQTLKPKSQTSAPSIVLNNIRRGPTFCLIADIEIDGKDLSQMLIEKGLARRIIRLETADDTRNPAGAAAPQQIRALGPDPITYVAAKSSKIFHRSTCSHAKRLNPDTTLTFRTRQEAEQNGRRPCKTCNP